MGGTNSKSPTSYCRAPAERGECNRTGLYTVFTWLNAAATITLVSKIGAATI